MYHKYTANNIQREKKTGVVLRCTVRTIPKESTKTQYCTLGTCTNYFLLDKRRRQTCRGIHVVLCILHHIDRRLNTAQNIKNPKNLEKRFNINIRR